MIAPSSSSTATTTPLAARTTLGLLAFDGFLCAVLSLLYLPLHIGATAFPITILIAAVVNLLLVMGARTATDRARLAAVPILGWLVGFGVCMLWTPGADVLVFADWRTLLLFIAATLPAGTYLLRVSLAAAYGGERPEDGEHPEGR